MCIWFSKNAFEESQEYIRFLIYIYTYDNEELFYIIQMHLFKF